MQRVAAVLVFLFLITANASHPWSHQGGTDPDCGVCCTLEAAPPAPDAIVLPVPAVVGTPIASSSVPAAQACCLPLASQRAPPSNV